MKKTVTVPAIVLGVILLIALGALIYWVFTGATLADVRDLAVVFLAVLFAIGLVIFIVVAIVLLAILLIIKDRIVPILEKLNQTANTLRGTTEFVSHEVVSPLIRSAGFFAATRALFKTLVKGSKRR